MRIVCPACSVAYDVPDSLVTPGRVVRCARCGQQWTPTTLVELEPEPPPEESAPEPIDEPPPAPVAARPIRGSAMDRLAAHPAWPRPSARLRVAWIASVALLVLAVLAAFTWRTDIVTAWPPSARLYAAFGLHPQGRTAHD